MKLKVINTLVIIIFIFCRDLRGQLVANRVTSINQWHASLHIPLVRHNGAFTDWLKFVPAVTHHFCLLLLHIFCACAFAEERLSEYRNRSRNNVICFCKLHVLLWQLTSILWAINKYIMGN